jgi:DNA repair ATPase RecN
MISEDLEKAKAKLQYLYGKKETLENQLKTEQDRLIEINKLSLLYEKTAALLSQVSADTRTFIFSEIEKVITEGVRESMSQDFNFKILLKDRGGVPDIEFILSDQNNNALDLFYCYGGGIRNMIATLLRVAFVELYEPKIEGPIILDETSVHISEEYQSSFGEFIKQLSMRTGRQFILVSHQKGVTAKADKIFYVEKDLNTGESLVEVQ